MFRLLCALTFVAASTLSSAADRSAELAAVVAAERAFAARAQVVNARQAFVEYFAPDAISYGPFPGPAFPGLAEAKDWPVDIRWRPAAAGISGAGDMGYSTGPAEYRRAPDQPAFGWGHYTSVWGLGEDGAWRVLIDAGVSHPAPAAEIPDWQPPPSPPPALAPVSVRARERAAAALRALDARLGELARQDPESAFATVYAPEGRWHRPGAVPAVGREAALAAAAALDGGLGWEPQGARVAASADLGFTWGRGEQVDGAGAVTADLAYLNVWRREAGAWRLVVHLSQPVPKRAATTP